MEVGIQSWLKIGNHLVLFDCYVSFSIVSLISVISDRALRHFTVQIIYLELKIAI